MSMSTIVDNQLDPDPAASQDQHLLLHLQFHPLLNEVNFFLSTQLQLHHILSIYPLPPTRRLRGKTRTLCQGFSSWCY